MCKAMNRSLTNVLFGAFGATRRRGGGGKSAAGLTVKSIAPEDLAVQAGLRAEDDRRARLRDGGRAGAAPGARARRPGREARRRS